MRALFFIATILTLTTFFACNKEPGEGGTSTIIGKIWAVDLNNTGDTIAQYYAMDHDVYIIYGEENQTYDDKFATSLDGSFRFSHLTPGKYTIFTYSKSDASPSGQFAIQQTVEITNKKEEINLGELVIIQ